MYSGQLRGSDFDNSKSNRKGNLKMLATLPIDQAVRKKDQQLRTCFLLIAVHSREACWTNTGVLVDPIDAVAAIFTGPACTFVDICEYIGGYTLVGVHIYTECIILKVF